MSFANELVILWATLRFGGVPLRFEGQTPTSSGSRVTKSSVSRNVRIQWATRCPNLPAASLLALVGRAGAPTFFQRLADLRGVEFV